MSGAVQKEDKGKQSNRGYPFLMEQQIHIEMIATPANNMILHIVSNPGPEDSDKRHPDSWQQKLSDNKIFFKLPWLGIIYCHSIAINDKHISDFKIKHALKINYRIMLLEIQWGFILWCDFFSANTSEADCSYFLTFCIYLKRQ